MAARKPEIFSVFVRSFAIIKKGVYLLKILSDAL